MAVEVAVHFFTTADHFDAAPAGRALELSRLDNVQEAYFLLPVGGAMTMIQNLPADVLRFHQTNDIWGRFDHVESTV